MKKKKKTSLIMQIYVNYLKNNQTDELNENLITASKKIPNCIEIWILLYVIYKNENYRPGYKYCEMKFHSLNYDKSNMKLWTCNDILYNNIDIEISKNDNPLCNAVYQFIKFKLWKFVQLIFENCKNDFQYEKRIEIEFLMNFYQQNFKILERLLSSIQNETQYVSILNFIFLFFQSFHVFFFLGTSL